MLAPYIMPPPPAAFGRKNSSAISAAKTPFCLWQCVLAAPWCFCTNARKSAARAMQLHR
jgi:hypothetical protein